MVLDLDLQGEIRLTRIDEPWMMHPWPRISAVHLECLQDSSDQSGTTRLSSCSDLRSRIRCKPIDLSRTGEVCDTRSKT